jgi:hypothetical protein
MSISANEPTADQDCTNEAVTYGFKTARKGPIVEPDGFRFSSIMSSVVDQLVVAEQARTGHDAATVRRGFRREWEEVIAEWAEKKQREVGA